MKDKVNSLVFQGRLDLLINLRQVPYVDSGGLGELATCLTTVARAGARLKLMNANGKNHDLLALTRLLTVFDVYDSEAEAIASLGTHRPGTPRGSRDSAGAAPTAS